MKMKVILKAFGNLMKSEAIEMPHSNKKKITIPMMRPFEITDSKEPVTRTKKTIDFVFQWRGEMTETDERIYHLIDCEK